MTYRYTTQTRTLPGDIHTPVSTYLKLRDLFPQSALMESSDYHGGENGRSFIGLCPIASISIGHGIVVTRMPDGSRRESTLEAEGDMASALPNARRLTAGKHTGSRRGHGVGPESLPVPLPGYRRRKPLLRPLRLHLIQRRALPRRHCRERQPTSTE